MLPGYVECPAFIFCRQFVASFVSLVSTSILSPSHVNVPRPWLNIYTHVYIDMLTERLSLSCFFFFFL